MIKKELSSDKLKLLFVQLAPLRYIILETFAMSFHVSQVYFKVL